MSKSEIRRLAHQDPGKMAEQLALAVEWLEAVDHHEMLVDQDPNYAGHQTHVLMRILNAREAFRKSLESGEGEK